MRALSVSGLPVVLRVGLWMCVTGLSFALLVGMVRHLSAEMDIFVIAFWRNLLAALVLLPWILRVGAAGLRTRRKGLYSLRSLLLVASNLTLFFAITMMPLAEATALSFTSPLFATLLAMLLLGERAGPRRWLALGIGFAGTLIMLRPGTEAIDLAALLILFSAVSFAGVIVTGKMLAATESAELMVLYLGLLAIPLSLIPALFVWEWPSASQFGWLLGVGAAASMNMYGFARAFKIGEASLAMPFDFLRLPLTALVGFLAFAQVPDIWTWAGAAVIFASAIYISRRELQAHRAAAAVIAPSGPLP